MSVDLFWLSLAVKMAATAFTVVAASWIAERTGPVVGSLVATLPISAGPAYVFLALDHEPAFLAGAATASLALTSATALLAIVYAALAPRTPAWVAIGAAVATWFAGAFAARWAQPNFTEAATVSLVAMPLLAWFARRYAAAKPLPPVVRRWWDVPFRAAACSLLAALIITASSRLGPALSGLVAVFPIVMTSLMVILHPRLGGAGTAPILANCVFGLLGFALSLAALHLAVEPLGAALGLGVFFAVAIGWNALLALRDWRRRQSRVTAALRR